MSTNTNTTTFTLTDAKYLGSKVAADLKQMQSFYGEPLEDHLNSLVEEFVLLVKDGYLQSIEYGFKKDGKWVVAIGYEVSASGGIDQSPGRIPVGANISGASWYSYLCKSHKFYNLPPEQKEKIEASLPVSRSGAPDPKSGMYGQQDKSYSSGNVDVTRKTYQ